MNHVEKLIRAAANHFAFDWQSHVEREDALKRLPHLLTPDSIPLSNENLDALYHTYFMTAYCVTPEKHKVKANINRLVREALVKDECGDDDSAVYIKNSPSVFRTAERKHKPLVLVITTHFHSKHVIYQIFGKSFAAMRKRFRVAALALEPIDLVAAEECFDKVFTAVPFQQANSWRDQMKRLRKTILNIAPDAILYADTAMHPYAIFLSTLRLAPYQFTTFGHPAPTMSEQIDRFIAPYALSQKLLPHEDRKLSFPDKAFSIHKIVRQMAFERPGNRFIVPTTLHKLNMPFLSLVRDVAEATGLVPHITAAASPDEVTTHAPRIRNSVPNAVVHPQMMHSDYLRLLSSGEFFLLAHPFSGFCTVSDCFSQGLPGIYLESLKDGMETSQAGYMNNMAGSSAICVRTSHDVIKKAIELEYSEEIKSRRANLARFYSAEGWRDLPIYKNESDGIAEAIAVGMNLTAVN